MDGELRKDWLLAAPQSSMEASQCCRARLVALHAAARAGSEGGFQCGQRTLGQAQQPQQIHLLVQRVLGFELLRQIVEETTVFAALEGLGEAAGAVVDGIAALIPVSIGKQQCEGAPKQLAHFGNGLNAPSRLSRRQEALVAH